MAPRADILIAAMGAILGVAACGEAPPAEAAKPAPSAEAGYLESPRIIAVEVREGSTRLRGRARPGSTVRLATPGGEALHAEADKEGGWRLTLSSSAEPRIFGLSTSAGGRTVQAEGYVLVTPAGEAAVLRAGSGALRFDAAAPPRITAFDFDREGGAAVSGRAPPGETVTVRIDGGQAAEGRADEAGRFNIALPEPAPAGRRLVEITGEAFQDQASVELSAAQPVQPGPFRLTAAPSGVRVDWMTPGGGVQSTLLLD